MVATPNCLTCRQRRIVDGVVYYSLTTGNSVIRKRVQRMFGSLCDSQKNFVCSVTLCVFLYGDPKHVSGKTAALKCDASGSLACVDLLLNSAFFKPYRGIACQYLQFQLVFEGVEHIGY